ncbi:MAG: hypothetical protein FJ100_01980 [Deltaproteobacteria bacterium]|nr:hypothetical protein [Deltaproteobacteria bacterium]
MRRACLLAVVIAAGCADAPPLGDPNAVACDALGAAWCKAVAACAPYLVSSQYGDIANCGKRQAAVCMARVTAPDTGYNAAAIQGCATALPGALECEYYTAIDAVSACQPKAGKRKNAEPCGDHSQCQSGLCSGLDAGMCGQCLSRVASGKACSATADCEFGLSCVATQSVKVCTPRSPVGGTCDKSKVCLAPAVCIGGGCVAPAGLGKPCDTAAKNCDAGAGHYCHDHKAVCTAYQVAKEGEPCGYFDGDRVACAHGATCKLAGGGKGTCEKQADNGGSCSVGQAAPCRAGLVCNAGVCGVTKPAACQ